MVWNDSNVYRIRSPLLTDFDIYFYYFDLKIKEHFSPNSIFYLFRFLSYKPIHVRRTDG